MKIEITKVVSSTVTETVNVEPGYYKNKLLDACFYYLCPSGTLIHVNSCSIYIFAPDRQSYNSYIQEIVNDYAPCEQSRFEAAKDKLLGHLTHYITFPEMAANVNPAVQDSVTNNMNTILDPKEGQQEEATEQAAEQATEETGTPAQETQPEQVSE